MPYGQAYWAAVEAAFLATFHHVPFAKQKQFVEVTSTQSQAELQKPACKTTGTVEAALPPKQIWTSPTVTNKLRLRSAGIEVPSDFPLDLRTGWGWRRRPHPRKTLKSSLEGIR